MGIPFRPCNLFSGSSASGIGGRPTSKPPASRLSALASLPTEAAPLLAPVVMRYFSSKFTSAKLITLLSTQDRLLGIRQDHSIYSMEKRRKLGLCHYCIEWRCDY